MFSSLVCNTNCIFSKLIFYFQLEILGSRVLIQSGNETKTVLQGGECKVEGVKQFQIRQPGTDKVLFSARHPLVSIDRRIKKISSGHIITNKLRSPIDESIHITAEDLGLRGNERIQLEAKAINFTAKTGIRFSTTVRMNKLNILKYIKINLNHKLGF
ncbi:unnamed protein product [Meloidogyne enterolobii]|uniref:Uncharacterized protein n=1 Tax=Meloidogyne enterolobii TaxID=390850 RepID=A0ACB0ZFT9_MELEN